ncbi:hypothetical protein M758_UG298600 [Ceratodon purpureus]|uniref:Secreted protein n=1 Tax=Ceratodon purpureus TaxID=3225 RepID=A0A8T0HP99_CERPU|nr:hypothetical protein KC19_VG110700 [Ceratodon purpureus]KAG0596956.1 hypothetical protein M758_UG298600 [Ceratodon purpureus]
MQLLRLLQCLLLQLQIPLDQSPWWRHSPLNDCVGVGTPSQDRCLPMFKHICFCEYVSSPNQLRLCEYPFDIWPQGR